jgi:hypothetical protein
MFARALNIMTSREIPLLVGIGERARGTLVQNQRMSILLIAVMELSGHKEERIGPGR